MTVWVDGELLASDARHLSVADRGFQLGDGVFETLRASGGVAIELVAHLARLHRSADGLEIPLPRDVDDQLTRAIDDLLAADGLAGPGTDASVRITVSRGVFTARGTLPVGEDPPPTLVVQVWPVAAPPPDVALQHGISLVTSAVRRDPRDPLAALKTTSRAGYVYAKLEARRAGADDALFVTIDDHLSEATSANVFLVRRGPVDGPTELATPGLDCAILAGTTRAWLLDWAPGAGLRPVEGRLPAAHLANADEAFLASSVAGIVPILSVDGRPIGDGAIGFWTRRARADRESMIRAGSVAS